MAKIDDIYDAVDDFGLITSTEAKALGVSNAELVQQARRGKLNRVGRGVYRVSVWPYQEVAPYAVAVKSVGPNAYLYGESVVALLGLSPTDPSHMRVATPGRVRKNLNGNVRVVMRRINEPTTYYEGIPSQFIGNAIRVAVGTMGYTRALQAAAEAVRMGYITKAENEVLVEELKA